MMHLKSYYISLILPQDFRWGGWLEDEELHSFVRQNENGTYSEVRCRESEIEDGSLALLIRLGKTR